MMVEKIGGAERKGKGDVRFMLQPRLMRAVDEFLAIGGNHDLEEYDKYRNKMLDFLREEDHLILPPDDENLVLARDVVHFIDASKVYAKTTSSKEAYPHGRQFLERMLASDFNNWHYYDLALLISSVHLTESFEQARQLASKAEKRILQFQRIGTTNIWQGYLAFNMCGRILNAKYMDDKPSALHFETWMEKLKLLVEVDKDLELAWHITQIRWAIFNEDNSQILIYLDSLVADLGRKIGLMVRNEIEFYLGPDVFDAYFAYLND